MRLKIIIVFLNVIFIVVIIVLVMIVMSVPAHLCAKSFFRRDSDASPPASIALRFAKF